MTVAEFLVFYPQFTDAYPAIVLETYVSLANARFVEFCEDTEEARRLYTAHKLTLYAKTMPPALPEDEGGSSASRYSYASLAASGDGSKITSKKVENVAVTYSTGSSSSSAAATGLEDLTETEYGLQLLSLLRRFSYPRYVP